MNPTILWIPEFRNIWDRDKSKHKEIAVNEISYIVYLHDFQSPYLAYSVVDREKRIKEDCFGSSKWEPDEDLKVAINKFKELQSSPILRLLQASLDCCDKMTDYLNEVDLKLRDSYGKPVYTVKEVRDTMKEVGDIVSSLETIKEKVEKEQMEKGSIRGGSSIGAFER